MKENNKYLGTKEDLNEYCLKTYGVDFETQWKNHRRI